MLVPGLARVLNRARQEPGDAVSGRNVALLPIGEVLSRRDAGAVLLDGREPVEFAAGHVRGSVSMGLRGPFAECAGAVLAPDIPVVADVVVRG